MRQATFLPTLALVLAGLLLTGFGLAAARYDLSWHVVSGGGGHSDAYPAPHSLDGAVVVPAGVMLGGNYELQSGFVAGLVPYAPVAGPWYLPVVMKGL